MTEQSNIPRWIPVTLGAVILALGVTATVLVLLAGIRGLRFERVVAPGTTTLTCAKAGRRTVFHEFRTVLGGKPYRPPARLPVLRLALIDRSTSETVYESPEIDLMVPARSSFRSRYSIGKRSGVSVLKFRIPRPGNYILSASYPHGKIGPTVVLAVSRGFGTRIVLLVVGCLAIMVATAPLAIFLFRRGGLRRLKLRT